MAGVPDLQWSRALVLVIDGGGVHDRSKQRLHQIISDCAPLAARGCHSMALNLRMLYDIRQRLDGDMLAAIGATVGESLSSLQLVVAGLGLAPSFWPALMAPHLPHLNSLAISGWLPEMHAESRTALVDLAAAYTGQPLTITFKGLRETGVTALRDALNLPESAVAEQFMGYDLQVTLSRS